MKRLVLALAAVSTMGLLAAGPASAASVCVNADVNVNGNAQSIAQCLPE